MIDLRSGSVGPPWPSATVAGGGASPVDASYSGARRARSRFANALLVAAVLASLVACGAPVRPGDKSTPGSGTSQAGTGSLGTGSSTTGSGTTATGSATGSGIAVAGAVFSSPGCPGPALAESPCPDRPVPGARVEATRGSTVVATTTTDAAGQFEMRVPPGDYLVTAFNVGFGSRASERISVTGPVSVRLVVDSGLR
jgi:Carboxypeptidase regulatory-like domain